MSRMIPLCEPLPELSIEERLEKAKPKEPIQSSAHGGSTSGSIRDLLYPTNDYWKQVDNPLSKKPVTLHS